MHAHCGALTHNPSFLNLPCVVGCSKEDFRCDEHTWPLQHCNAADWKEDSTRQVHLLGRRSHHSASHGTSNICIPIVDAGSLTALCESFSILPSVYLILQLFHPCPTCDFHNTVEMHTIWYPNFEQNNWDSCEQCFAVIVNCVYPFPLLWAGTLCVVLPFCYAWADQMLHYCMFSYRTCQMFVQSMQLVEEWGEYGVWNWIRTQ